MRAKLRMLKHESGSVCISPFPYKGNGGARRARLLQLLRGADQWTGARGVPEQDSQALASVLNRRSERARLNWEQMKRLTDEWL